MKKTQIRFFSILLACLLICAPVSQVFAETAYDASMGVSGQLLFPKDSLVSTAGLVMLDGAEQPLAEGGVWVNTDEEKVFTANSAEDGTIHLTQAGYLLTVEGGVSEYKDSEKQELADNHYEFLEWEMPLETDPTKDLACFEADAEVRLIADEPEAGMQFAGWVTETEGVVLEDPQSMETVFVMPDKKVEIFAVYVPEAVQSEEIPSEEIPMEEVPMEEIPMEEIPMEEIPVEDIQQEESVVDIPVDSGDLAVIEDVMYTASVNYGAGSGSYTAGTWVTVTADDRTAEGLMFNGWYVDSMNAALDNAAAATAGFTMPESDVMLTATYAEIPPVTYHLTVNDGTVADEAAAALGLDPVSEGSFEAGTWVTVTADDRMAENLAFIGWYVDSMNASLDDASAATVGFAMPEGDVIITATYAEIPEPVTEAPVTEAPETEAPVTEAPVTEAPVTEAPETEAPQTEAPVTEAPQTEAPATEAPQTEVMQTEVVEEIPIQIETNQADAGEQQETNQPVTMYSVAVTNGNGSGEYAPGNPVYIEATVPEGFVFTSWKVTPETVILKDAFAATTEFTMPAENVTVEAQYTEKTYKVTLTDAVFAEDGTAEKSFKAGETVTVTASDLTNAGKKFTGWSVLNAADQTDAGISLGDAPGTQISFTMPAKDLTVSQTSELLPNTYTVQVSNGLINGSATTMTVEEGTVIDVAANPGPTGQAFAYWRINDGSFDMGEATYSESIRITVTQNLNILAVYEGIEYAVNVKNGYSDYSTCAAGSVVTITANPAPEGKVFDHWKVKSENASLADAYSATTTFTMPQGDVSVVAKYRQITYQVTVENGKADQDAYFAGDTVTITSNYPASGREFSKWDAVTGNVTFESAGRWKTTFVMPAADVAVRATYKDGPSSAANAIQELIAGGEYLAGSTIKFTAYGAGMDNTNPNPGDYRYRPSGYQISNVTGTWQAAPYTTSMTIKASGEYTLKVIFNKDVYNGEHWVSEGTSDAKSATFYVVTEAEGVDTGDETPLIAVIAIAAVSCLLFIVLMILFIKRRRR